MQCPAGESCAGSQSGQVIGHTSRWAVGQVSSTGNHTASHCLVSRLPRVCRGHYRSKLCLEV